MKEELKEVRENVKSNSCCIERLIKKVQALQDLFNSLSKEVKELKEGGKNVKK